MKKSFEMYGYRVEYDNKTEEFTIIEESSNSKIGTFEDIMECGSWFYSNMQFDKAMIVYLRMEVDLLEKKEGCYL